MKLIGLITFLFALQAQALPETAQLKGILKLQKQQTSITLNITKIKETQADIKYHGDLKTNCELCVSKNNLDLKILKKNLKIDGTALLEQKSASERFVLEINSVLNNIDLQVGDRIQLRTNLIQKTTNLTDKIIDSGFATLEVVKTK